ncbi:MAG: hypothetical protein KDI27_13470, partial [Gammaproteobacteria bacterium]|nr:hypothetical protein [Gammaproteobacteria bacterium]
ILPIQIDNKKTARSTSCGRFFCLVSSRMNFHSLTGLTIDLAVMVAEAVPSEVVSVPQVMFCC